MAEALTSGSTFSWTGGLDATAIEAELARLRQAAVGEFEAEGGAMRTNLLNLVVYAWNREEAHSAVGQIVALAGHHPSRMLVFVARPSDAQSRIDAALTAHCHKTPGVERRVCCEEVDLTVRGPAAAHLHSIVAALLIPDLPVYVWWRAPVPEDRHVFSELVDYADRLIVDSARLGPATTALPGLAHLLEATPSTCAAGDLNWARLAPWRDAVAPYLAPVGAQPPDRIEVAFAGPAGGPASAQACLLLAWLATSLGVDIGSAGPAAGGWAAVKADGQRVVLRVVPRQGPIVDAGTVLSLTLGGGGRRERPWLQASLSDRPLQILVTARGPLGQSQTRWRIGTPTEAELLAQELDSMETDRGYRGVLAAAAQLWAAARD